MSLLTTALLPLIILGFFYQGYSNKNCQLANRYLIAIIAAVVIVYYLFTISMSLYGGWVHEQFRIIQHQYGIFFYPVIFLQLLLLIFSCLNFLQKYRVSNLLQIIITKLFVITIVIETYANGWTHAHVNPGWHTTVVDNSTWVISLVVGCIGLVSNWLIVKNELLPEISNE